MRLLPVVAGSLFAAAACVAPSPDATETTRATTDPIVGGSISTSAQDAVVLLAEAGAPACTGVLVATNLVLTARHCVTRYDATTECGGPLGPELATSLITVSVGVHASSRSPVARATRFFVPAATDLCGDDIALVALDRDVTGVAPAKVRFGALALNESTTAIGYGDQGSGRRQRTDVRVLALGPAATTYETVNGQRLPMNVPANELTTTESTCYGDSGGPLLDVLGQVVAIASRGLDDLCVDRPTYWTSVAAHEQLVRAAAAAVGHPLPEATTPAARNGATSAASDSNDAPGASDAPDDGDEDAKAKRSRKARDRAIASAGCSIGRRRVPGPPALLALALGLAVASRRRRR